jgi:hypothetical protein
MISAVHLRPWRAVSLSCLLLAAAPSAWARSAPAATEPAETPRTAGRPALASWLAAQVREIAGASSLSRAKKEKRISTTVRTTVIAATAYKTDPDEVLGIALDITAAAGRAAPSFAEVISNAVAFASPVAKIDGAAGQIRATAFAATRAPARPARRVVRPAIAPPELPPMEETEPEQVVRAPTPRTTARRRATTPAPEPDYDRSPAVDAGYAQMPDYASAVERPSRRDPSMSPSAISLGDNITADVTLDLGVRRDSNIFSSPDSTVAGVPSNKVAETITTETPGIDVQFGQHSLAHGGLGYRRAYTQYRNDSAPSVALSSGYANLGYDNGTFTLNGTGALDQSNRSSNEAVGENQQEIFRQDTASASLVGEARITGKTGLSAGYAYSSTKYQLNGLADSKVSSFPLNVYYSVLPKLDVSLGYTPSKTTTDLPNSPSSDEGYSNVGFRGALTPKLSGTFSVGYRTREVEGSPKEDFVGFNGAFNYEITPKTGLSLNLSRDFSTGALGETLIGSNYALRLTAEPTTQWQVSAGLNYRTTDFGSQVFRTPVATIVTSREDKAWSGGFSVSYLFTSWLSASLDYQFNNVSSSIQSASFKDNVFGLQVGLRY